MEIVRILKLTLAMVLSKNSGGLFQADRLLCVKDQRQFSDEAFRCRGIYKSEIKFDVQPPPNREMPDSSC